MQYGWGRLRINADPDRDEGNPLDLGPLVASADGPWAVDVTVGGNITGKSGSPDERTVPIVGFAARADGTAFDPATRYAFSYDFVAASDDAELVNLDAEGEALYAEARVRGGHLNADGECEVQTTSHPSASL